jgi:hypothetical protein
MIDATHDPWTAVLDQLWDVLETDASFCAVVQPGNRIKFDKQNPFKTTKQNADCPEVIIEPVTGAEAQAFTSTNAKTQQAYAIQIVTLDMRLKNPDGTGAADIAWLVWQILSRAGDSIGGMDGPIKTRLTATVKHYVDPLTTETKGWCVLMTLMVDVHIPKTVYTGTYRLGGTNVIAKTSSYQVLAGDSELWFTNTGAAGMVTFTLPAAKKNLHYHFIVTSAVGIAVVAQAGDGLWFTNASGNPAASAQSTQVGAGLDLVCTDDGMWTEFKPDLNWSIP